MLLRVFLNCSQFVPWLVFCTFYVFFLAVVPSLAADCLEIVVSEIVTATDALVLRPLLEDRGCITESIRILVPVDRMKQKCFQITMKRVPRSQQFQLRWQPVPCSINWLSSLSTRPTATIPATEYHCPLTSNKLYCLMTEARV